MEDPFAAPLLCRHQLESCSYCLEPCGRYQNSKVTSSKPRHLNVRSRSGISRKCLLALVRYLNKIGGRTVFYICMGSCSSRIASAACPRSGNKSKRQRPRMEIIIINDDDDDDGELLMVVVMMMMMTTMTSSKKKTRNSKKATTKTTTTVAATTTTMMMNH